MQRLTHHLRGLLVALAALALTAGVAFAARPSTETGLDRAAEAAGKAVPPVSSEEEPAAPEVDEETVEDEEEPAAEEDGDETEPDGEEVVEEDETEEDEAEDGDRPLNHGWYVSEAAKGETPDGYRNHGEYVSEIARGDDGKPGTDAESDEEETDEVEAGGEETEATTVKAKGKDRAEQAKAGKAERAKAAKAESGGGRAGK
jgi:hypothetical protein